MLLPWFPKDVYCSSVGFTSFENYPHIYIMAKAATPTSLNCNRHWFQLSQWCTDFTCLRNFKEMPQCLEVNKFWPILHLRDLQCHSCGYHLRSSATSRSTCITSERNACHIMWSDSLILTWMGKLDRDVQVFVTARPRERFWENTQLPWCRCNQAIVFVMIPEHNFCYTHHWTHRYVYFQVVLILIDEEFSFGLIFQWVWIYFFGMPELIYSLLISSENICSVPIGVGVVFPLVCMTKGK